MLTSPAAAEPALSTHPWLHPAALPSSLPTGPIVVKTAQLWLPGLATLLQLLSLSGTAHRAVTSPKHCQEFLKQL